MSGLNDGFEISEEVEDAVQPSLSSIIFDDATPGKVPNIDEDVTLVTAVVDQLTDMSYLRQDMLQTGGMSKSFALEAERLMPGFITEERPLAYFTIEPTKTQYRVSLEAVDAQQVSLVDQIIEAIGRMIQKVIDWIRSVIENQLNEEKVKASEDVLSHSYEVGKRSDRAQASYKNVKYVLDSLKRLAADQNDDGFKAYLSALETELNKGEDYLGALYRKINTSDEFYSIVTGSDIVNTLFSIASRVEQIFAAFAGIDDNQIHGVVDVTNDNIEEVRVKANQLMAKIDSISRPFGIDSFHSGATSVKMHMAQRNAEVDGRNYPLAKIVASLEKTMRKYDPMSLRSQLLKATDQLQTLRRNVSKASVGGSMAPRERARVSQISVEAIRKLNVELTGAVRMIESATNLIAVWTNAARAVRTVNSDFQARVSKNMGSLKPEDKKAILEFFDFKPAEK